MKKLTLIGAILVSLFVCSVPAGATPLPPGTPPVAVDPWVGALPAGAIIADTGTISGSTHPAGVSFMVREWVYQEAVSGTLDFIFQLKNTLPLLKPNGSPEQRVITRMTTTDFTGWITDAFYSTLPGLLGSGTTAPGSVDRYSPDSIGFNIVLHPQDMSYMLIIKTNATTYKPGTISVINGGVATVGGFAPAPLPGSIILFGTGALSLGGGWFWRRRNPLPEQV